MVFQFVQLFYWLALSTWFGSAVFVAVAAPVIFDTIRQNKPILSHVLSVNMDGQHGELLAGSIVSDIIHRLARVQLICGGVLLILLAVHPFVINMVGTNNQGSATIRSILFLAAAAVGYYDFQIIFPRTRKYREHFIEHADEPEVANPSKELFDRNQRLSVNLLMVIVTLLLGLILFSATISRPQGFQTDGGQSTGGLAK